MTARKPRILHCVYSGLGGHAAVLFTLLDERTRDAFDHFVLFFGVEELCEDYARACERIGVPYDFVRKRGRVAVRSHRDVVRAIGRVRPDVVFINGSALVLPLLGARAALGQRWAVAVRETQANHLKTRAEWVGSYAAARFADAVVYLSAEYRDEVRARLRLRGGGARVHVVPNGVDTDVFGARVPDEAGVVRLSMVSRLIAIKDHATLIEAVRVLVRDRGHGRLVLRLAGDGPTRAALEAQALDAGVADVVRFEGLLPSAGVAALLGRTDVYVHATFGETMSNSILQAMAAGLPIVASDVRGVNNMLRHGDTAVLVPPADPAALADALEALVRAPEERERLGARARAQVAAELSQQRMVERYRALLADLAEGVAAPVRARA